MAAATAMGTMRPLPTTIGWRRPCSRTTTTIRIHTRTRMAPTEAPRAPEDARVRAMFRSIIRIGDPVSAAEGQKAYDETLDQISQVVEREQSQPSDTLLGEILRTLQAEDMATLEACQQIVLSLLLGGYETTSWLLANAIHALLSHPEAQGRVRRDASLLVPAIEESMRWCPSVAGTLRMVERDVELEGLKLSAGTVLYLAMVANHYDDTTYPSPERFDLEYVGDYPYERGLPRTGGVTGAACKPFLLPGKGFFWFIALFRGWRPGHINKRPGLRRASRLLLCEPDSGGFLELE